MDDLGSSIKPIYSNLAFFFGRYKDLLYSIYYLLECKRNIYIYRLFVKLSKFVFSLLYVHIIVQLETFTVQHSTLS